MFAVAVALALLGGAAEGVVDCSGWPEPCAVCSDEIHTIHYQCLSIGRGDSGEDDCESRRNCTWYEEAGSNYWAGGSLQCVVDVPAVKGDPSAQPYCCETGGGSSCYPLGTLCPDCLLPDGLGSTIAWLLFIAVLLCCVVGCYLCFTRQQRGKGKESG